MTTTKKQFIYLEHYVQVTDKDSGGDTYAPVYVLLINTLPKELIEQKAIYNAGNSRENLIKDTGNSCEYTYGGLTGRAVTVDIENIVISETEWKKNTHTYQTSERLPEFEFDKLASAF